MSFKLIDRPKTSKVTKSLAKSFAEMEPAPHDRPLSERRLQVYSQLLADGLFRPVTWASAICKETGDVYRVNGKHTSIMLSGLEKMPEFFVTIEEYECDTLEDVAKLYSTFDSSMMSRSARDIYLSFAGTVKELASCSVRSITTAAAGISYHLGGETGYSRQQPAERAEYLLEYPEFVIWLHKILSEGPEGLNSGVNRKGKAANRTGHICRMPVVAAMFACWTKAKGQATEFWTLVRDETGTKPDMPDRKIARWLMTSTLSQKEHGRVRNASTRETYVKCLHAWNAWRKGESTNLNYYAEKKVPSVL